MSVRTFGTAWEGLKEWAKHPLRQLVLDKLDRCQFGSITLTDSQGTMHLGTAGGLHAHLHVRQPSFFRQVALGGSLAAAQTYVRGDWECDDLTSLFRWLVRNQAAALDGRVAWIANWLQRCVHRWHANSKAGSRRNIRAHYDLGNNFFRCWLDDTWAYSSGIFPPGGATLREASLEKFDRACRKLALEPDDHLLEIGTGWGGLAMHAAARHGCRVTSTTISEQQLELASHRIAEAGLAGRVTLLPRDYRDLSGQYDKLVSIEMIEAVGHEYLDTFFRQCGQLLKPSGSFLLQAIVMPERGYGRYLQSVDFIRRYIFPGGCLPSVASILESVGRSSRLRLVHLEDMAPHYAETLRRWRQNVNSRRAEIQGLGYSEEFLRLWEFYLCYCEAAFEERHVGVVQMVFDNHACRRDPLTVGQDAARWFSDSSKDARLQCGDEPDSLAPVVGGAR